MSEVCDHGKHDGVENAPSAFIQTAALRGADLPGAGNLTFKVNFFFFFDRADTERKCKACWQDLDSACINVNTQRVED